MRQVRGEPGAERRLPGVPRGGRGRLRLHLRPPAAQGAFAAYGARFYVKM